MRCFRHARYFCTNSSVVVRGRSGRIWTEGEDTKLRTLIMKRNEAPIKWGEIAAELGTGRDARSARQRWEHTLSPQLARGPWRVEELKALYMLRQEHGNDWAAIAAGLPTSRTTRQVRERVLEGGRSGRPWSLQEDEELKNAVEQYGRRWTLVAKLVTGRTDNQCMERWTLSLDPRLSFGRWSSDEDDRLRDAYFEESPEERGDWSAVSEKVVTRNRKQCAARWKRLCREEQAKQR